MIDWRIILTAWLAISAGCAAPGRDQSGLKIAAEGDQAKVVEVNAGAEVKAQIEAAVKAAMVAMEVRIGELQTTVDASMRDVHARISARVGGGGDSITAWLYAAIAGAAILYPVGIRPVRIAWERRSRRRKRLERARHNERQKIS